MIEASDRIRHLITHRAEVFSSLEKYKEAFDVDALFRIANAGLSCAATAPSFILTSDKYEDFQYDTEIMQGKFAMPFPEYSVLISEEPVVVCPMKWGGTETVMLVSFYQNQKHGWRMSVPTAIEITGSPQAPVIHHFVSGARSNVSDAELERFAEEKLFLVGGKETHDEPALRQYGEFQTDLFFSTMHEINRCVTPIQFRPAATQPLTVMQASKKPLPFWEYRMVEINKVRELPAPPKGGTHATPRWHQVRGFWRTSKNGVKHFVKSFSRGDKTKGIIEHDYTVMV